MALRRILEPEVMDTERDATEYDGMDFTDVNLSFALRAAELAPEAGTVLDVGTGTARIPILFLQQSGTGLLVHAVDLSAEMLKIAARHVVRAGLSARITLHRADGKVLPFPAGRFDMVMSNSLVHHLPEPRLFFSEVARIIRPGGAVFVRDLRRPDSTAELEELVQKYAGDADPYQQKLFRDSLHASLTIPEIALLVSEAGLDGVQVVNSSDRHWSAERVAAGR
jgi:ubiquinone/menaquinone biosynthesis C-methylase UbiE